MGFIFKLLFVRLLAFMFHKNSIKKLSCFIRPLCVNSESVGQLSIDAILAHSNALQFSAFTIITQLFVPQQAFIL